MKAITRAVLLITTLASVTIFMTTHQQKYFFGTNYEVRVINGFTNNSSLPLIIWCSSNRDDLGGRALQEGDDFSWRLRTSFWGNPHYLCTVKWDFRRRKFDAFKATKDIYRCSTYRKCSWLVREDGFYFSNDEVNWKKDFSWL